jgi:Domain of unknown function (DUF4111)
VNDGIPLVPGSAVDRVLASIQEAIVTVIGSSLVGLYLAGSLATRDFEADASDIDLIAVLTEGPDDRLAKSLDLMHADLAHAYPVWDGRIEVIYISADSLANCLLQTATIAVINPGEPFHMIEAGQDWILSWYPARENGVTLVGPPIDSLIPPIPTADFVEQVHRHMRAFPLRIPEDATPGSQAYAILTMCRGLYMCRYGEQLSKRQAATWAQGAFPQWADLILQALAWRQHEWELNGQDGAATVSETRRFVAEMARHAVE